MSCFRVQNAVAANGTGLLQPGNGHLGGGVGRSCAGRRSKTYLPSGQRATPTGGLYWGCVTPSTVSGHLLLLASSSGRA
eukprot:3473739-Lingulodinium_polyedra.AAC.1